MKYGQRYDGDWVKPVMKGYRIMCCDCKLVHVIDFKVVRSGRGLAVKFKIARNNRATAAARRARSTRVTPYTK